MAFLPASSPPLPSFSCPSPFPPLLSPLAEGVPPQVFKCPAVCGQHPGPAYSGDTPPPATWGSRCPTAPSWPLGPSHWLHCHLMSLNALSPHKTTRPANPFHKTKLEAERGSWVAGPVTSVPTPWVATKAGSLQESPQPCGGGRARGGGGAEGVAARPGGPSCRSISAAATKLPPPIQTHSPRTCGGFSQRPTRGRRLPTRRSGHGPEGQRHS